MRATPGKSVLRPVLAILSLPLLLALFDAVSFHVTNRNNGTMVSSGEKREYLLYVPGSYDPGKPTALVISMHAAALWPTAQRETSQWNRVADREGFIVVYPSGLTGNGPIIWRAGRGPGLAKDVRFISDLIDTLSARYNIDPLRIYANGLSNGGGMAFVLSCTLSGRIAAVGLVGAAHLLPWSWCTDDRPVPMIAFHGTADPAVPFNGGTSWISSEPFPNIPRLTANWARRNRCGPVPADSAVAVDVTRIEYPNCADSAAVVFYRIQGGGHTWPGGMPLPEWFVGATSTGVDATSRMWAFFRDHPLSRSRQGTSPTLH